MDNGNPGADIDIDCPFVTYEGIKNRLRALHDTQGQSWPKIAKTAEFSPIPAGTLYDIYCGKKIPKRWHKRLRYPPPRPPRISIRLDNPESAAKSIAKHMELVVMDELIDKLIELLNG
jgi:hypothetical protein